MASDSIRKVFSEIEKRYKKGVLERDTTFYFTLGDGPGEKWTVKLGKEACEVKEGKHTENADCVVKTSPAFLLKMVSEGYVPSAMDFMWGKIKSNDPYRLEDLKKALGL